MKILLQEKLLKISSPNKNVNFILLVIMGLCFTISCIRPDIEELPFIDVITRPPEKIQLGEDEDERVGLGCIKFTGELSQGLEELGKVGKLVDHGFIWSEQNIDLDVNSLGVMKLSLGRKTEGITFDTIMHNFPIDDQKYHVRAYAIFQLNSDSESRVVQGKIFQFDFEDDIFLTLGESHTVKNNTITVSAVIAGLQRFDTTLFSHGFIYSAINKKPEVDQEFTDTVDFGKVSIDYNFSALIDNLKFNTTYYFRAFAKTQNDYIYSDSIKEIQTLGGWNKFNNLPDSRNTPIIAQMDNRIYYGLGCLKNYTCDINAFQDDSLRLIWQFTLNESNDDWTNLPVSFNGFSRMGAVAFSINGITYVGLGRLDRTDGSHFYYNDFWRFDPSKGYWELAPIFKGKKRWLAVAFVLNGKAYVGTGEGESNGQTIYYNDFYEFDPEANAGNGEWTLIDSLPAYNRMNLDYAGRSGAIGFSIASQGKAYVGTGETLVGGTGGPDRLDDFWEFDGVTKTWKRLTGAQAFPGEARVGATTFTINDVGYIGIGRDDDLKDLQDFWRFDGTSWSQINDYLGPARWRAIGFSLGGKGYVGGGQNASSPPLNDMWVYTPDKK